MIEPLRSPPTIWVDRGVWGVGKPVVKARLFPRDRPGPMVLEIIGDDAKEAADIILAAQAAADAGKET